MPWMEDQEWAWRTLSPLLDDDAALRLTLCAMETQRRALWQFFVYYEDCRRPLRATLLLHLSIANGCWRAAATIQRELLPLNKGASHRSGFSASLSAVETLADSHGLRISISAAMASVIRHYDLSPVALPPHVMYEACRLGRLDAVLWLHTASAYHPYLALEAAAKSKQLETVKWLLRHHMTAKNMARPAKIRWTLKGKHADALGIYAWSVQLYDEHDTMFTCAASREHGLLPRKQVESLRSTYPLQNWAAEQGHADVLNKLSEFLSIKELVVSPEARRKAAERGHLAVIQWVCSHTALDQSERKVLFADALINGRLDVAQHLYQKYGRTLECTPYVRESADSAGHGAVVRWIDETFSHVKLIDRSPSRTPGDWNDPQILAAKRGRFKELQQLTLEGVSTISPGTVVVAAGVGHLEMVKWLYDKLQTPPGNELLNDEDRLMWEDRVNGHLAFAVRRSAITGHLEVVRWLVEEKGVWDRTLLHNAIGSKSISMLEFVYNHASAEALRTRRSIRDILDCNLDVVNLVCTGNFDMLQWLLTYAIDIVTPRDPSVLDFLHTIVRYYEEEQITLGTQTAVLNIRRPYQWSLVAAQPREKGLEASRRIFLTLPSSICLALSWLPQWAIRTSSYEVLKALAAMQHPEVFTASSLRLLLQSTRDSNIVRWFLDQEVSASLLKSQKTRVVQWAARYARVGLLKWLLTRCEDLPTLRTAVWTGAKHGHTIVLECVAQYMSVHDLTQHVSFCRRVWRSAASIAVVQGHLDAMKWLYDNKVGSLEASKSSVADIAARYGHFDVLRWIYSSTSVPGGCSMRGLQSAVGNRHVRVVLWLTHHDEGLVARASQSLTKEITVIMTKSPLATPSASSS